MCGYSFQVHFLVFTSSSSSADVVSSILDKKNGFFLFILVSVVDSVRMNVLY